MLSYFAGVVNFSGTDILIILFAIALPWTLVVMSFCLGLRDFKRKQLSTETKICLILTLMVLTLPTLTGAF